VCGAQGGICRVNIFLHSRSLLFSLWSQRLISPHVYAEPLLFVNTLVRPSMRHISCNRKLVSMVNVRDETKLNIIVTCTQKSQRCLSLKTETSCSPHTSIELYISHKTRYLTETNETEGVCSGSRFRVVAFNFPVSHLYQEALLSSSFWLLLNGAPFRQDMLSATYWS
jgi:hypothetical protein